jgi:acid phosphatase family membrane protein YuiD
LNSPDISWHAILVNEPFWIALSAWLISAILKVLITLVTDRRLVLERFLGTGGMPSTHTSPVLALTTILGILYGLDHPYFTIGLLLSFIVMYDATNLRQESGKHAMAINILFEELASGGIHKEKWKKMQELLGHTYLEVAVGAAVGVLTALIGHHLWMHFSG